MFRWPWKKRSEPKPVPYVRISGSSVDQPNTSFVFRASVDEPDRIQRVFEGELEALRARMAEDDSQ